MQCKELELLSDVKLCKQKALSNFEKYKEKIRISIFITLCFFPAAVSVENLHFFYLIWSFFFMLSARSNNSINFYEMGLR
jgi:hypothetical protein